MQQSKRVNDSRTEQFHIIMPEHINGQDRLFGGRLVEWIDVVAAVVARRHANHNVTTVTIDNLQFKRGAHNNDLVVLRGKITYVGRTSMEVRVDTYIESLNGEKETINTAFLVLVALDENENPVEVPRLKIETEQQQQEWDAGARRRQLRQERRAEQY